MAAPSTLFFPQASINRIDNNRGYLDIAPTRRWVPQPPSNSRAHFFCTRPAASRSAPPLYTASNLLIYLTYLQATPSAARRQTCWKLFSAQTKAVPPESSKDGHIRHILSSSLLVVMLARLREQPLLCAWQKEMQPFLCACGGSAMCEQGSIPSPARITLARSSRARFRRASLHRQAP